MHKPNMLSWSHPFNLDNQFCFEKLEGSLAICTCLNNRWRRKRPFGWSDSMLDWFEHIARLTRCFECTQVLFPRRHFTTSLGPSCELNNQWLPFEQAYGYLDEHRGRATVHVCKKKKKRLCSFHDLREPGKERTFFCPLPAFVNFLTQNDIT